MMAYEATKAAIEDLKSIIQQLMEKKSDEYEEESEHVYDSDEGNVVDEYMGVKNGDVIAIEDGRSGVVVVRYAN
jgi:hypothetical protein